MKKLRKALFIIFIILLVAAGCIYIDYFLASRNNTNPKIAIKKQIDDNLSVYNGAFYRMWYCKSNDTYTLGDYKDTDAVCNPKYEYDNGYYTNGAGVKISQHDLEMIEEIYDDEVIETMNSDTVVSNAVYVAENYAKLKYKEIEDNGKVLKSGKYNLVSFPTFEESKGKYSWTYDNEEKYCLDETEDIKKYAPYEEEKCGEFVNLTYDTKWCELYVNSKLYFDEDINKICGGLE